MPDLSAFGPLLLATGLLLVLFTLAGRDAKPARAVASAFCAYLSMRYIWWRYAHGMPMDQAPWQQAWAWVFFGFEAVSVLSSTSVYLFMSRHRDRSAEADARQSSPLLSAPVDVFIATYNESQPILERTIIGALSIEHPDLRVWVLDDGARDWVQDLARQLGAMYVRRVKGKHAKAGNVNNGLREALSAGRRPEFILLLDADFVANRTILRRTLGLFEEPDVGIVQTPQHFFNPDPIQSNLLCTAVWPDEQRFFFNTLLSCKDAWGAAFCCGTSAVFRVEALEVSGGMAVETVTEDMLTTFKMEEHGYRTVFLNEALSMGLAPEGLKEYVAQRARWCLGAVQQIYTRWSFAGVGRVRPINRLSCLDTFLFWASNFPFKVMMLSAPLVYWWTGTAVIASTGEDLLRWLAPAVVASMLYMGFYAGNRVVPVMTDVTQLLSAFVIVRTVATGLVKPWGHPFKVTAKGVATDGITVQWNFLLPFAGLAAATLAGVAVNTNPYSPLYGTTGYAVNVFWSMFNVAVLLLAAAVCVELPKRREDERFVSGERAALAWSDGQSSACTVRDISLSGARLTPDPDVPAPAPRTGELVLDGGLRLPFETVRGISGDLAIHFKLRIETRRRLIARLFTGRYRNEVERVSLPGILRALSRKLMG